MKGRIEWSAVIVALVCAFAASARGRDFYVSPSGDDAHPGTLAEPFATIQWAVDQMGAGDTCYIRGGTYRETIDLAGVAGTTDAPVTLMSYNGETVTLDGTTAITNRWTLDEGQVYKTTVDQDVTQLFVDGELMTLARYPNALVFSSACWNGGDLAQDAGSSNGTVIDAALEELDVELNGCVAIMNFGAHATGARLVEDYVPGSNTFNYAELDKYKTSDGYFLEGGSNNAERVLLDTAEEWAYDESTGTLYLWTDDGLSPEGREIYAKGTNAYAISGDADTQNVVIDGVDFFATAFYLESSDRITIQNCDFEYYAASQRSLGSIEPSQTAFINGNSSNLCVDVTIYNCAFRYADGGGLWVDHAENPLIENNLFYYIDYACVDPSDISDSEMFNLTKGTVPIRQSRDITFRRNTIMRAGSGQGVAISLYDSDEGRPCVLEYNYLSGCARRESDGAAIQIPVEHATHSTTRYNWFIGNHQRDFRWDGPDGGPLGNLYRNVALAETGKVIAALGDGFCLKGDYHEIYNNVGVYQQSEIWAPGNAQSTNCNNAADSFLPDTLSGITASNYVGDVSSLLWLLRDPDNHDFRPRAGYTNLIDQGVVATCDLNGESVDVTEGYLGSAPDIGAYEYGDTSYWIPGRQEAQASVAVPEDGAEYARTDADLMYLIGLGGESANIYFGTSSNALEFLTSKSDPENIVTLSDYTTLDDSTTYYWRVDTVLADSSVVTGEVWSFTTMIDREFMPWEVRSINKASWAQNQTSRNLVYDNYDTLYSRRSLLYSTNSYRSSGGFKLTVGYTAGTVACDLSHSLSFGLIRTDTDLSSYSEYNPFLKTTNVYSLGVNVVANGDGSAQGLNFTDGSTVTTLDASGDHVQFGTYEKFETMESNVVEIDIGPDGAWSYAINGITEASGTITNGFDLSRSYRVAVYAQDDNGDGKAIQHMSIEYDAPPEADDITETVTVNDSVAVTLSGSDPEGSNVTYSVASYPTNGVLSGTAPNLIYTPDSDYSGSDSFTYTLNDGVSDSDEATVSILIVEPDSAPVALDIEESVEEGGSVSITLGGTDADGDTLSYTVTTYPASGTLSGTAPDLSYAPTNGFTGVDSFTYTVSDAQGDSAPATVSITVYSGYTVWASDYGLTGEDALSDADVENDGYDNLEEYALGMDPTRSDACCSKSTSMVVDGGEVYFEYVHQRLTNYIAAGISYLLIDSTNLVNAVSATNAQDQIIVGPQINGYESVTNRYSAGNSARFIKLEIHQD